MATAKKETAHKAEKAPTKAPVKKAASKAAAPKNGASIIVQQTGSPIGRQAYQRATLIGLGLNKMRRTRELQDSPEVRGMINAVKHLVKIVEK